MEIEEAKPWSRKGKTYRTKYLSNLRQLYKEVENGKAREGIERADQTGHLVDKTEHQI